MKNRVLYIGLALFLVFCASQAAVAFPYYQNDFELTAGSVWTTTGLNPIGVDTTPSGRHFLGGYESTGPNLSYGFSNETVTLTLTGLPAHDVVALSFDLFVIQSWDGNGESAQGIGLYGVDTFDLQVDSVDTLLHTTFRNVPYPSQSFPGTYVDVSHHPSNAYHTGAAEIDTLGYPFWGDAVYNLHYTFAHSSDTLTVQFTGIDLQQIEDESWGLDNIRVDVSAPEPSTWLLLTTGLLALAAWRRHTRS